MKQEKIKQVYHISVFLRFAFTNFGSSLRKGYQRKLQ